MQVNLHDTNVRQTEHVNISDICVYFYYITRSPKSSHVSLSTGVPACHDISLESLPLAS